MSNRTGIQAAEDGKHIDDRPLAYSSEHGHLMIDTRPGVKHLDIYDGNCGKQVLVVNNNRKEEIFYKIEHKLKYIPRVSVYMLIRDAPASLAFLIGRYAGGWIFTGGVPMSEGITTRVDEKYVYLVRYASMISTSDYTSTLQDMKVRAKIMINSNEVAGEPYELGLAWI
jgi:hypothetical protein